MSPIRTVFAGAKGRMGAALLPGLARTDDIEIVAQVDVGDDLVATARAARAEVVIDFTVPSVAVANARRILDAGCHGVIGTTGFTESDLVDLDARARTAKRALLIAPNFALGVLLMVRFAAEASRWFQRSEIVELHHDGKLDAPSGTALRTAQAMGAAGSGGGPTVGDAAARGAVHAGVHIHSVRIPGFTATQEVMFGQPGEVLTIRHDAFSRECYLPGVVMGVRAVRGKTGLLRGLESILPPPS